MRDVVLKSPRVQIHGALALTLQSNVGCAFVRISVTSAIALSLPSLTAVLPCLTALHTPHILNGHTSRITQHEVCRPSWWRFEQEGL